MEAGEVTSTLALEFDVGAIEMKNMIIPLVVALTCGLSNAANAQKLLENGLYAGTFWVGEDNFPVSYFLETTQQLSSLEEILNSPSELKKLNSSFDFFDTIVVTSHPLSILDKKINPKIATFAAPRVVEQISGYIDAAAKLGRGCIGFAFGAVRNGKRAIAFNLFVYSEIGAPISEEDFESCIRLSVDRLAK